MRRAPLALLLLLAACRVKDPPPVDGEFSDLFERDTIGSNWFATGGGYQLVGGALNAKGAHNHPLWLRKKLPRDCRIELTVWSNSPGGDIKVEVFGDGRSYDPDQGAYTSSGYVIVMGGWSNSKSIIAKQDEHGDELVERAQPKVVKGRKYHWVIERVGKTLTWFVDGDPTPFLQYEDDDPLDGDEHAYFAIDNWENDTWFDDLRITAL